MRSIPKGWQELEIKDFLKFTPREIDKPNVKYRSLGIRSHCKGTFVREVENPDKVMMETLYTVKKDDLIVNITFAWEGAVALVNKSDEGALVSHRFPTYVFNRNVVIPEFFRYLIPSKRLVYNLGVISPGGAGRNRVLDRKDFSHLQFIMPPVEEQKVIAEIISTWDQAIETLGKLINAQTRLKKSLMQKLLTGKVRFKAFDDKWELMKLGQLIEKLSNGIGYDIELTEGLPITRIETISDGKINYNRVGYAKNIANIEEYRLRKGDILFSHINSRAHIGKVAYYDDDRPLYHGINLLLIRVNGMINSKYLFYFLSSEHSRKQIQALARQAVNQASVNTSELKSFLSIYTPTNYKEQEQIAGTLSAIDSELELLLLKYEALKMQKKYIMQKLLTGKIRVRA